MADEVLDLLEGRHCGASRGTLSCRYLFLNGVWVLLSKYIRLLLARSCGVFGDRVEKRVSGQTWKIWRMDC
jgi:hypothetical protein